MKYQFTHVRLLARRLGMLWCLLLIIKLLFILLNRSSFNGFTLSLIPSILFAGLRFDLVMIIYTNGLFILLHLLPFPFRDHYIYQRIEKIIFLVINIPVVIIELADTGYFPFNNKRMTADIVGVAGAGLRNSFSLVVEYWYLLIVLILFIYILFSFYTKWDRNRKPVKYNHFLQVLIFLLGSSLCILGARGGWQTIPVTPANATDYTDVKFAPLVLNSTYSIMYSVQRAGVADRNYLTEDKVRSTLNTQHIYTASGPHPNIMLIILESYAREYVGYYNDEKGFTPFTDSLMKHSIVFTNAFANAERSNKSMCVLLGGLPSLTDDAFMNTIYSSNCFEGIGTLLKQNGYYTSFLHGGLNGEFKFDSYTKAAGFDHYYGKNEFGNDKYFDGNWGIYDHVFFNYAADVLNKQPQPFCSAIFSLSAHHPFNVPAELKPMLPDGDKVIHEAIGYTDYALQLFFNKAKKMSWFKNTVFIVTADHTFGYGDHPGFYNNAAGKYAVPLFIYKGDNSLEAHDDSTLAQHLDILPTILDLGNFRGEARSYGKSVLRNDGNRYALQYLNNIFQVEDDRYILFFDGKNSKELYDYRNDLALEKNLMSNLPQKSIEM
ncbi:MAG: LTA synthase family protein, partial [Bacteroidota bacterium]